MTAHKDKKTGKWYVQYRVKDIATGKYIHKKKRGFETKREALAYEREALMDVTTVASGIGSKTFREIIPEWEAYMSTSENTKGVHAAHFRLRFSEYLNKPLKDFTRPMLNQWRAWLDSTDYATATKNRTIEYVCSVFDFLYKVYDLKNPAVLLKPFGKTQEEVLKEMDVWTVAEFNQFVISSEDSPIYHAFFMTLFWTGLRKGEAVALAPSDLDEEAHTLTVRYSQKNMLEGRKPTKTKQMRTVTVSDFLLKELLPLKERFLDQEYLFGGDAPISNSNIDRKFSAGIKATGVKRIRIHDLRHSHATLLINNGANIVAVSKRLGHATIEQTLKTYTHLLRDSDEQLMQTIEKLNL